MPFDKNATYAALLYSFAAEQGDVQSLMSLGFIVQAGDSLSGIPRNLTAARAIFESASEWERSSHKNEFGFSSTSTQGMGPALAQAICWLDERLQLIGLESLSQLSSAWYRFISSTGAKIYSLFSSSSRSTTNANASFLTAAKVSSAGFDFEWCLIVFLFISLLSIIFAIYTRSGRVI